ncbi:MAG TPA: DNA methyltransferase [Candidatus Glassbacteria bacterium]|nr:DNA methyltransferase [Candidatus Glassbacteria bacterium]
MSGFILNNCLNALKDFANNSIDEIVTDPPYGIKLMGKSWDIDVPSVEIWKECLRILKPGAFAFVMSAARQDVLKKMIDNLEKAGFVIGFTSIYWAYSSGMPKARNIGKAIDKKLGMERKVIGTEKNWGKKGPTAIAACGEFDITIPASEEAKKFDGLYGGFQPKPAVEIIIVAMKPLSEKGFTEQALKNGKGGTWMKDCRIPFVNEKEKEGAALAAKGRQESINKGVDNVSLILTDNRVGIDPKEAYERYLKSTGRFPANLLVGNKVLNNPKNVKKRYWSRIYKKWVGIEERIPARVNKKEKNDNKRLETSTEIEENDNEDFSAFFSRFFDLDKWFEDLQESYPFLIIPKPCRTEKDMGVKRNIHPSTKPIRLMAYLIMLGSREGDIVLDPFVGSGTTCLAAKVLKRKWVGIDKTEEYLEIAKDRMKIFEEYLGE